MEIDRKRGGNKGGGGDRRGGGRYIGLERSVFYGSIAAVTPDLPLFSKKVLLYTFSRNEFAESVLNDFWMCMLPI